MEATVRGGNGVRVLERVERKRAPRHVTGCAITHHLRMAGKTVQNSAKTAKRQTANRKREDVQVSN